LKNQSMRYINYCVLLSASQGVNEAGPRQCQAAEDSFL